MTDEKVQIFISHISEEQVEANRAKEYLEHIFKDHVDVFLASSWTSIPPGEDWFSCIMKAIERADIMLVFCSGDSVGRAWLQFETGAGWFAKQTKVIPVCHKGMTPPALPDPVRRLQAVDVNAESEAEQMSKLAAAIRQVANLPESSAISVEELPLGAGPAETPSVRGWVLRPGSHLNEEIEGVFRVGTVGAADPSRATAAGIDPDDAIYVRLFVEPPTGQYVNAMATGQPAALFEREDSLGCAVQARIKLCAAFPGQHPGERAVPVIVVEDATRRAE